MYPPSIFHSVFLMRFAYILRSRSDILVYVFFIYCLIFTLASFLFLAFNSARFLILSLFSPYICSKRLALPTLFFASSLAFNIADLIFFTKGLKLATAFTCLIYELFSLLVRYELWIWRLKVSRFLFSSSCAFLFSSSCTFLLAMISSLAA